MAQVYGGDEVSALVLDIGASSTRCGYAGDDSPRSIFSTAYGFTYEPVLDEAQMLDGIKPHDRKVTRHLGDQGPLIWRSNMEVSTPIKDGLITDFTAIPSIISYAIEKSLGCNPKEHPIMVTESTWNQPALREQMAQILFEEFEVPAFYIANTGVLNSFASGKGSALVLDIGQDCASVVPVVDGFVLRKGITRSNIPTVVRMNAHHLLSQPSGQRAPIALLPHQLISNKMPVESFQPPQFTYREDRAATTTESWKTWAEQREVDEWVSSVAGVLEQGWSEGQGHTRPQKQYEFPTGYNAFFGAERFQPGEVYFNNAHIAATVPDIAQTIPMLLSTSLSACDPDLRATLLNQVLLTGGGSLLSGFATRLHNELGRLFGTVRLHAAGNQLERRYSAWLGGSILASLGTFQQLWISKEEWQEHGKGIVAQRCK